MNETDRTYAARAALGSTLAAAIIGAWTLVLGGATPAVAAGSTTSATGTPVKYWSYGLTEAQASAHLQGYARTDPTLKALAIRRDSTTFYATTRYNRLDWLRMSNGWGINSHTVLRFDDAGGAELGRLVIDAVPDRSTGTGYTSYWYCDRATATTGAARTRHPGQGSLVYRTATVHYQVRLGMLGRCGFARGSSVHVVAGSGLFDTQYGKASGEWKSFISDSRYAFRY